jgi:hypothetical protein
MLNLIRFRRNFFFEPPFSAFNYGAILFSVPIVVPGMLS